MTIYAMNDEFFQNIELEAGKSAREQAYLLEDELRKTLQPSQAKMLTELTDLFCLEHAAIQGALLAEFEKILPRRRR